MTDTLAERLLERWEYIQSVQRNVDAYSGNEAAGNAEILRLKAKFADEAHATLKTQASRIAELERSKAEKDEALAYAESILTAVSSAGAGEALNRVRKARSHSSEVDPPVDPM
jgi:hypothetical protein